jgi:hypothetical protein
MINLLDRFYGRVAKVHNLGTTLAQSHCAKVGIRAKLEPSSLKGTASAVPQQSLEKSGFSR